MKTNSDKKKVNLSPVSEGYTEWTSPSNIAFVKYWGKRYPQLPMNANLSMTLDSSVTRTSIRYTMGKSKGLTWKFLFEGKEARDFHPKIEKFLNAVWDKLSFLSYDIYLEINSSNTFPHSSGIASSASAMSALALCLVQIEERITGKKTDPQNFVKYASEIARLGSGSASRSLYPGYVIWGETEDIPGSSDYFAIPFQEGIHSFFQELMDYIHIVSREKKSVSSTAGHELMETHPYAERRYAQASLNLHLLINALKTGNKEEFVRIVENEALSLHGLMMSSDPGYLLLQPETLKIISEIREFREKTGAFICFTLDAGPNVHVLFHENDRAEIEPFILSKLSPLCENNMVIKDKTGSGPENNSFL